MLEAVVSGLSWTFIIGYGLAGIMAVIRALL